MTRAQAITKIVTETTSFITNLLLKGEIKNFSFNISVTRENDLGVIQTPEYKVIIED